ncbi:MAG TPA: hypothetical protein VK846_14225 [Candidatus Limnocylindria bacterium]|nr:hypothetical protein [Candidatus Limnocylindria bacterium]
MINRAWRRREFLQGMTLAGAGLAAGLSQVSAADRAWSNTELAVLPKGGAPTALSFPHFPSRLHAFVWRNWQLVPADRLAATVGARSSEIAAIGRAMGLGKQPRITADQQRRSYITVIKRNWHLLPYAQLLTLLDWTPQELAFTLREDDFLFVKLGNLKPKCTPLKFAPSDAAPPRGEADLADFVRNTFPRGILQDAEPLFQFVEDLRERPAPPAPKPSGPDQLRFCYSYFALYGDPLLERDTDPYPDNYLARLAATGVNGVWLQAVLHKLAPCPWQPSRSAKHDERLKNLGALVARARHHGIRLFLYLNEPRALPLPFFAERPELKGVTEGDHASLCTSQPAVRDFLTNSIASICRAVPGLGGFFTITGSENLTNCWSHGGGKSCPRCRQRGPAEVIAEVNGAIHEGVRSAGGAQQLIVWDWGWNDAWAAGAIARLPADVLLMSVSEWSLPIERGGVKSQVGEYSISSVGPGPRAKRHWQLARERGLKTVAKIQAGNTWELSAVPYIPALSLVAEHAEGLRTAGVDGLMLGWTLGGYPSPNLEAVGAILAGGNLKGVAVRRFGEKLAPAVLEGWQACGEAFREFPYSGGVVYSAPLQNGPSNLLWDDATGYRATMVGFPYDDLESWRSHYPSKVFTAQMEKVATGFATAAGNLNRALESAPGGSGSMELAAARAEASLMRACSLHWQAVVNQSRFVIVRRALAAAKTAEEAEPQLQEIERLIRAEAVAARELLELQKRDSRLGFEASNHYYYVPMDLAEKMLNCRDLEQRWLPGQRARFQKA